SSDLCLCLLQVRLGLPAVQLRIDPDRGGAGGDGGRYGTLARGIDARGQGHRPGRTAFQPGAQSLLLLNRAFGVACRTARSFRREHPHPGRARAPTILLAGSAGGGSDAATCSQAMSARLPGKDVIACAVIEAVAAAGGRTVDPTAVARRLAGPDE